MEPQSDPSDHSLFDLKIDEVAKNHIRGISSWVIIVVVTSVLGYLLSVIQFFTNKNTLAEYEDTGLSRSFQYQSSAVGLVIEIIIGLLLAYFLYQFANLTRKGVNNMSQEDLNRGFVNLRTYFTFIGVIIIILIVFLLLGILAAGSGSV